MENRTTTKDSKYSLHYAILALWYFHTQKSLYLYSDEIVHSVTCLDQAQYVFLHMGRG